MVQFHLVGRVSMYRGFTITLRHDTIGSTPMDECLGDTETSK